MLILGLRHGCRVVNLAVISHPSCDTSRSTFRAALSGQIFVWLDFDLVIVTFPMSPPPRITFWRTATFPNRVGRQHPHMQNVQNNRSRLINVIDTWQLPGQFSRPRLGYDSWWKTRTKFSRNFHACNSVISRENGTVTWLDANFASITQNPSIFNARGSFPFRRKNSHNRRFVSERFGTPPRFFFILFRSLSRWRQMAFLIWSFAFYDD